MQGRWKRNLWIHAKCIYIIHKTINFIITCLHSTFFFSFWYVLFGCCCWYFIAALASPSWLVLFNHLRNRLTERCNRWARTMAFQQHPKHLSFSLTSNRRQAIRKKNSQLSFIFKASTAQMRQYTFFFSAFFRKNMYVSVCWEKVNFCSSKIQLQP